MHTPPRQNGTRGNGSVPGLSFLRVQICFSSRQETLEQVFGDEPISLPELQHKLWRFIVHHSLASYPTQ